MGAVLRKTVLTVGVIYFRPGLEFDHILELFQVALGKVEEKVDDETIIIGGDFNARVSESNALPEEIFVNTCFCSTVRNGKEMINPRGPLLLDLMQTNGYVRLNGRSPGDCPAKPTHYCKNENSVIHLVFAKASSLSEIKDLKIETEASLSDHFPVKLELYAIEAVIEDNSSTELGSTKMGTRLNEQVSN